MSNSDNSDTDKVTRQHRKKNYHEMSEKHIKRRRSQSVESYEKHKKRKNKPRDLSESDSNEDSTAYRSKHKKYGNKHDKLNLDSENEKTKLEYKKNKRNKDRRSRSRSVDDKSERSPEHKKSTKSNKNKFSDLDQRSRYHSHSESETEEQKRNSSRSKHDKHSKGNYNTSPSTSKKKNSDRTIEDEYKTAENNMFSNFRNNVEDKLKEIESGMKNKDRSKSPKKGSAKNKYENSKSYERHSKRNEPQNGDEDDSNSVNERPYRQWNIGRGPVRKNSDSYWNKYSDRLKESTDSVVQVGARYYGSLDTSKKETSFSNRNKDSQKEETEVAKETPNPDETPKPKKTVDLLTSKTGGAYIPPARLRMMQESITDKSSAAYQRLAWEALKKSIQGHVNKVNTSNVGIILKAIQKENIVRGKGLLCRSLIQAQAASPTFTNVYAAFVSVLNAKFPMVGELLLKRLIVQFRRGFKRNDKTICITAATFIAHLVNQEVAHEIVALEILTMLIETPTNDSVEVAIAFLKECGMKLTEVSSKGIMAIFDMLRNILHEGQLEKRVQYMIEVMFQIRKEDFKAHPSIVPELNLLPEEDKIQHMITLEENHDPQDILNVFKLDPDYEANEAKYKSVVDLGSDEESEGEDGSGSEDSDDESDEDGEEDNEKSDVIIDRTETNLVALRKTIYLTIQSSLDFEECAHKLLRMELKPGQEIEMVHMFIDCCAEQRTYEKFFGLLSQRFCQINRTYIGPFEETFRDSYATIHRMTNDKLRNVAKLFAHLLYTDAISWDVLATIRLNEDDTTSSSRIFIKILFLELSEYMGLAKLNQRVKEPNLQVALAGLFPRDNPKHTRFAINFFTSIGLGGLTDELREHLKAQPRETLVLPQLVEDLSSSSSSSSESSSSMSSSDSSSSDLSSSSDSSSSESKSSSKKKSKKRKLLKKKKKPPPKRDDKSKSSKKKVTPVKSKKRNR